MTGTYGLLGRTLGHSYSPQIHAQIGDYPYKLFPIEPEAILPFLQRGNWAGLNVTIPYKETVMPYLDAVAPEARRIGSVNTIVREADGTLTGHNTDAFGFSWILGDCTQLRGQKALVLGSGGASKTVQAVLAQQGIEPVVISRTGENNYTNLHLHTDARCIVNTTPVGMYPEVEQSPIDLAKFPRCALVLDLIYNPAKTTLLLQAEELGIPCRGGIGMLCAQAVQAARLWGIGQAASEGIIDKAASTVARSMRSIALIGMPGSGKSSIGKCIAQKTGRLFIDTDELIVQLSGKSIPEIFRNDGEEAFRTLETQALSQAAKQSHAVIATGGGVVIQSRNRIHLQRNCAVVCIDRALAELSSDGRPLSQALGTAALYAQRAPLYAKWADATYQNVDIAKTAMRIQEDWA